MERLAISILPGYPYHVMQRGNRRQGVFFGEEDYEIYLSLLKTEVKRGWITIFGFGDPCTKGCAWLGCPGIDGAHEQDDLFAALKYRDK